MNKKKWSVVYSFFSPINPSFSHIFFKNLQKCMAIIYTQSIEFRETFSLQYTCLFIFQLLSLLLLF